MLDVLAIPGHEQSHNALYDRQTGILLTGDTLYPGLLFIDDWATYRESVRRLAEFVASHAVSHVLGAHVEMTATARINYPYGATYQPDEHALRLDATRMLELDAALGALGASPPAGPRTRRRRTTCASAASDDNDSCDADFSRMRISSAVVAASRHPADPCEAFEDMNGRQVQANPAWAKLALGRALRFLHAQGAAVTRVSERWRVPGA